MDGSGLFPLPVSVFVMERTPRASTLWGALLWAVFGLGCATTQSFNGDREALFGAAVEASLADQWAATAGYAFAYRQASAQDDDRYDRSQMLLAKGLEGLALYYGAAVLYLDVASAGRNPELIDGAVAGLQRVMGEPAYREAPRLIRVLGASEFSDLRAERRDFVNYIQGLDSVRRGLDAWAGVSFARVSDKSDYRHWAAYVQAVVELAQGRFEQGRTALAGLLEEDDLPMVVANEVRIALARLAMQEERYDEAIVLYEALKELSPERPDLVLEMAWAHYYSGDPRRALGLLLALDAPIYRELIAPERYLLEARCLRRLCQFEPARIAAARLLRSYGAALTDLHEGVRPEQSESIREAARRRGMARDAFAWTRALTIEQSRLSDLRQDLGPALGDLLSDLYARGVQDALRREDRALRVELVELTEELVLAQDGVRLILHELSVGLLRGRRRPPGPHLAAELAPLAADTTNYAFDGEFWTDELDDLVVTIEDRCLE